MTDQKPLKKAAEIGFVCIFTYVINYVLRNLLGVLTPEMINSGICTKEYPALLTSVYMVTYAVGQLINGVLGDHIKPKYMVSGGLSLASVSMFLFYLIHRGTVGVIVFGTLGFGLSMMRGPLVKVISENTKPKHARICCVFLSFSSFAGPLIAGFAALIFDWKTVFLVASLTALAMAIFAFLALTWFEKCGMIVPIQKATAKNGKSNFNVFGLLKLPNFMVYMVVGMVVEIAAASINFWMPTYFNQHLAIGETTSNLLFSMISLLRALCPFLSLFIFRLFRERDVLIVRVAFSCATALFAIMFFVRDPVWNVALFTLGLMCSSVSSATLWSIYIPSLAKTGNVSGANGVLDCTGYAAAALLNLAIVPIMDAGGWGGVIFSWCAIMFIGAAITLFAQKRTSAT
jgi:sugar phosphate permease